MLKQPLFIAAIGASAGGHQALKEFFSHLPPDNGIAFCVITHLARGHRSILDQIISRYTKMNVTRMKATDVLLPNHIYVLPEGVTASIKEGRISLRERKDDEIINRTVDDFLISLAEDQRERAIAIILSGMGDDGSRGAQLIHEFGGMVMVQEPDSTPFRSMPENAIKRDHPDQVMTPAFIAKSLVQEVSRKMVEWNRA
jgi:chemotaxis response regulator CheB